MRRYERAATTDFESSRRRRANCWATVAASAPCWTGFCTRSRTEVRTAQLAHQKQLPALWRAILTTGSPGVIREARSACGSKGSLISPFPFPPPGQTGAGGFPPRRKARLRASQPRLSRACGSPHKRAAPPCASPAAFAVLRSFAWLAPHILSGHYFFGMQTGEKVLAKLCGWAKIWSCPESVPLAGFEVILIGARF